MRQAGGGHCVDWINYFDLRPWLSVEELFVLLYTRRVKTTYYVNVEMMTVCILYKTNRPSPWAKT